MSNVQLLNLDYVIMMQDQIFKVTSKEWRWIPQEDKNFTRFKEKFFEEYQDWKVESKYHESEHSNAKIVDGLSNCERTTTEALKPISHSTDSTSEEKT